eukprot:TRINITY_DN1211_c4_g1_i1.p1 TRINITY_DN1211_c4_g1~~TRINITY_DN1211_c4_g1_i1.p1  ORF type:complete len:453 (+),score=54.82 TRINITY_DN1211_c4_g1_i1:54-1361(+)
MALDLQKEIFRITDAYVDGLLNNISDGTGGEEDLVRVAQIACLYDPVYAMIEDRGLVQEFVSLIDSKSEKTEQAACDFLKHCSMYEGNFGPVVRKRFFRMLELVGDDNKTNFTKHAVASLLCHMARNEYSHKMIIENTYSQVDMLRSRELMPERAAVGLTAYAITNPYLIDAAVGVTARTEILKRVDITYKTAKETVTRSLAIQCLKAAGFDRSSMTNDDIISVRDYCRLIDAGIDSSYYFTAAFSYSMMRQYFRWGFKGQMNTVILSATLCGLTSTIFGNYTGQWLDKLLEDKRYEYLDGWGTDHRKRALQRLGRVMNPIPGGRVIPIEINERYDSLKLVTKELSELRFSCNQKAFLILLLFGFPLPWYTLLPKIMTERKQLLLGPRFHRLFPALSLKYTRRSRAIVPFVIVPTLVVKAAQFMDTKNPLRRQGY